MVRLGVTPIILTKDSITVAGDAVVYYKIADPMLAVCSVADYSTSIKLLAGTER